MNDKLAPQDVFLKNLRASGKPCPKWHLFFFLFHLVLYFENVQNS